MRSRRAAAGYAVRVEPDQLDVHRFERLADAGSAALETGRFDEAAASLAEALGLWRGEALGDLAGEDAVYQVAARLEELRLIVRERMLEAELGRGRHADVLPDVQALAREHPLRERPHGLLMLALYRCGRQAEALEAYRTTRARLVDELGIEPGPALQELEQQILRQDAALIAAGASSGRSPAPAPQAAGQAEPASAILVAPLDPAALDGLAALGEPLARDPRAGAAAGGHRVARRASWPRAAASSRRAVRASPSRGRRCGPQRSRRWHRARTWHA